MQLRYGLNDRLKLAPMLLYGLQWLMICIPGVITGTFIAPEGETVFYTQKVFAIVGATMLIQVFFGHRMPMITGPAAVLFLGVIAAKAQGFSSPEIYSSLIAGGAIIALLALTGLLKYVQKLFTIRIVVSVLVLISIVTTHPVIDLIFSDPKQSVIALAFAIACAMTMALANDRLKGMYKSMVVIVAMILGSLFYYTITGFPDSFMHDTVQTSILCGINFNPGIIVAFCFCYIALAINEIGSIQSLGQFIDAPQMEKRNKAGLAVTGIMNMAAGAAGVIGPVDFSLSPGIVASTQCASRYSVLPAAAVMILLAFMPSVVSVLLTIPQPVMGTMLLYLMATQLAAGFSMLNASGCAKDFRDAMILALPVIVCILISFAPQQAFIAFPSIIRPIIGNGFIMGIISIMVLEHILLKKGKK